MCCDCLCCHHVVYDFVFVVCSIVWMVVLMFCCLWFVYGPNCVYGLCFCVFSICCMLLLTYCFVCICLSCCVCVVDQFRLYALLLLLIFHVYLCCVVSDVSTNGLVVNVLCVGCLYGSGNYYFLCGV